MNPEADHLRAAGRYVWMGALCIAIMAAGVGLWAGKAVISGALIANGVLEVAKQRQPVQHPLGGVVDEVLVQNGDEVSAGDLLIRLDIRSARAELAFTQEQVFELRAHQDRLRAQTGGFQKVAFSADLEADASDSDTLARILEEQRRLFAAGQRTAKAKRQHMRQQQSQIATQILGANAQIAALTDQIELVQAALDQQESLLSRGLTSSGPVLDLRREIAGLQGRLGELNAARTEAQERHFELELGVEKERDILRERAMTRIRDLEGVIREYRNEARRWQDEIGAAEIRAPVSGVVHGLNLAGARTILNPGDPALFIMPLAPPALVRTRVSPSDIDLVHKGQRVKLRLSTLATRTTPEILGVVTGISADTIADERTGTRFFEVTVDLQQEALDLLPDPRLLVHGMPVETFIQTGDRTPLAYLVKPLADYFARAFRES